MMKGAGEYPKDQQTDLSTATCDRVVRDPQGKTRKIKLHALPDVDPSSQSISQITPEIESADNGHFKASFSTE